MPVTSPPPKIRKAVRLLAEKMRPHLAHQTQWEPRDGAEIYCRECRQPILRYQDVVQSGQLFMTQEERDQVRELVSKWIWASSDQSQRIFPMSPGAS